KLKYPRSVFFIISNEFCERFSYYGMRSKLLWMESSGQVQVRYQTRNRLGGQGSNRIRVSQRFYSYPLHVNDGAVPVAALLIPTPSINMTILYLSVVYAIGNVVISVASATGAIDIPGR
ncbi:unnamed protein product, partial [Timema podura]|nr:unnamed protein product [Timema podura]